MRKLLKKLGNSVENVKRVLIFCAGSGTTEYVFIK